jgi:hypothetical protein
VSRVQGREMHYSHWKWWRRQDFSERRSVGPRQTDRQSTAVLLYLPQSINPSATSSSCRSLMSSLYREDWPGEWPGKKCGITVTPSKPKISPNYFWVLSLWHWRSTQPYVISFRCILILSSRVYAGLPSFLHLARFHIKILHAFLKSPMHSTCPFITSALT